MNRKGSLRRPLTLLAGALIYAGLYALCSQIDETGVLSWSTAAVRFAVALPVALAALWLLMRFVLPKTEMKPDAGGKKPFCTWGAFAFIFCCYVPMFLIEFPGSFTYDVHTQTMQISSGLYSTYHPLLHTLMIRWAISLYDALQSLELCMATYSAVQMVLTAFCFAQVCASLSRGVSRHSARLSMLFFGLYPSHMAFASNCTKDVLFSAFFALFLALCFEEFACGLTRGRRAMQIAAGVLACLLRNNMVYAMIAWAVVLLPVRKECRRMALCGVLVIAMALGAGTGLKKATHAESGSIVEMFSVPIQQLVRVKVYEPEKMSREEADVLYAVSPDRAFERYEPTISDPVKCMLEEVAFRDRLADFLKTWVSVGIKCPKTYLEAFLNLALPSLYPYSSWHVRAKYIETGIKPGALTNPLGQPDMVQPGRFAGVRDWLDEHLWKTGADDIPVIRWLLNTGFIFWLLLLLVLYDVYCGRWSRVLLCMLPVLLWGTYLLGPVMQGRYLYPFICVLPLFLFRQRAEAVKTY